MILDQLFIKDKNVSEPIQKTEKHSRSILKAISWRALGTLDTITISWFISGELSIAFSIGAFELLTKTILYYFHERMWNRINWGK